MCHNSLSCPATFSLPQLLSHILYNCRYASKALETVDPSRFSNRCTGAVSIPCIPTRKSFEYSKLTILKIGDDKHFLFTCDPKVRIDMIYFHTYFFGVPEDAKSYQFKMKLKAEKDGPSLERTALSNFCLL